MIVFAMLDGPEMQRPRAPILTNVPMPVIIVLQPRRVPTQMDHSLAVVMLGTQDREQVAVTSMNVLPERVLVATTRLAPILSVHSLVSVFLGSLISQTEQELPATHAMSIRMTASVTLAGLVMLLIHVQMSMNVPPTCTTAPEMPTVLTLMDRSRVAVTMVFEAMVLTFALILTSAQQ